MALSLVPETMMKMLWKTHHTEIGEHLIKQRDGGDVTKYIMDTLGLGEHQQWKTLTIFSIALVKLMTRKQRARLRQRTSSLSSVLIES